MIEKILASGKIFELVQTTQPDGRVFERARRAPGVRLIIADKQARQVLLTREFRHEIDGWDYRLPGGKVFDTLEAFEAFRSSGESMLSAAEAQAANEARQEAGVNINKLKLFKTSILGATVEWDLFVFEAESWTVSATGQELEAGEDIDASTWVGYEQAESMILDGDMQEERIALILLQWLKKEMTSS